MSLTSAIAKGLVIKILILQRKYETTVLLARQPFHEVELFMVAQLKD